MTEEMILELMRRVFRDANKLVNEGTPEMVALRALEETTSKYLTSINNMRMLSEITRETPKQVKAS